MLTLLLGRCISSTEAENGTEDAPAGGLSGANSRGPSPPRSPEGNGEGLNFGGRSGSGERLMEEEEQQKQESSRAGGRPDVHGVGGGPGGRRTQHRVVRLESIFDFSLFQALGIGVIMAFFRVHFTDLGDVLGGRGVAAHQQSGRQRPVAGPQGLWTKRWLLSP